MTGKLNKTPPLYNPAFEHDGCGTGFIAKIDGERSHKIVELAVRSVANLTHRGAILADATSGDGAGVTLQLPRELLADDAAAMGMDEKSRGKTRKRYRARTASQVSQPGACDQDSADSHVINVPP